jgi:beta-barrel assembly-enhancing protease
VRGEWAGHYLDGHSAARHAATVRITPGGLEITLAETGARVWWSYTGLRQTQGFYEGEQVRLERDGEALQVADVGFLRALRVEAPQVRGLFHDPARRRFRVQLVVLAAMAALTMAIALYQWGLPAVARVAAARVPVAWEEALGRAVTEQVAPVARRCVDPERQRRIDDIVATLVRPLPEQRYTFRVAVLDTGAVNAFAAPGGHVVVYRGLLDRTESAEELAGVLAHEIQHVLHRHSTQAIFRQASAGLLMAALVGDVSGLMAFGLEGARALADLGHSRSAEDEADRDGMRMLHAAGIDPGGMIAFYESMHTHDSDPSGVMRYLSTHPSTGDRLTRLRALAAEAPAPPVTLLAGYDWSDIKRLCGGR